MWTLSVWTVSGRSLDPVPCLKSRLDPDPKPCRITSNFLFFPFSCSSIFSLFYIDLFITIYSFSYSFCVLCIISFFFYFLDCFTFLFLFTILVISLLIVFCSSFVVLLFLFVLPLWRHVLGMLSTFRWIAQFFKTIEPSG